jgi:hypothetical protein
MKISVNFGGLWGDKHAIFCLAKYLHTPIIHVWSKKNCVIWAGDDFINNNTLQILYHDDMVITQLQLDVDTINNQCFCTPPNNSKFPYSFYTNEAKQKIMNQLSFEVEGMSSYCMHKIDIMIHVLNHFNYKMTQISQHDYIQRFK